MPINYLISGQYKVLSDDDLDNIHLATLEVLDEVGVKVDYLPALELMKDYGCRVDFDKRIVQMPEYVLKKALSTAPSRFTLYGRDPKYDVKVDTQAIYTIGGSSALSVLDLDGNRRPATKQDLADFTRLQDALENLHIMHAIVIPQDIVQEGFDRILFSIVMKNTARNYYSQGMGEQSIRDQIEMASVILGSTEEVRRKPIFTIVVCLTSPLVQADIRVAEIMESARHGIPLYVEADAQPGATTPITLAGTLVEQSANILCGIALAQMVNPGTPCIYAIASGIMDMVTANYSGGAPETTLLHSATAQVAHYYNLPFQGGTGIDATVSDAQAGYERALQVLGCALSGVNFIHLSIGMMEQMLMASYEQCVIDNEILGAALHIAKGIEVNKETIALDVIKEVGPGGNYLAHDHTIKHFRKTNWFPRITNRKKWEDWMIDGGKDMRQRANEVAREILANHHPQYLSDDVAKEIDKMAESAQKRAIENLKR
ncbi:MAG: trimethylamine methyltransferase family protein [Candidatus Poribacteria bacterium]